MLSHKKFILLSAAFAAVQASGDVGAVSFSQAIDMGVKSSKMREAARSEDLAQEERVKAAKGGYGPKANVSLTETRFDKPVSIGFGPETFLLRPDESTVGGITISQPLIGLYNNSKQVGLVETQKRISETNLALAEADAAFATAQAYLAAQESLEIVRISRASLAAAQSQSKDANALLNSGRIIQADFLKIELSRLEAQEQLSKAIAGQEKAIRQLTYRLGASAAQPLSVDALLSADAAKKLCTPYLVAPSQNESGTRLELVEAHLQAQKAVDAKDATDAKMLPTADAFVGYEHEFATPAFGEQKNTTSFGIRFNWEIWDSGSKYFARHEAEAESGKARAMEEEKSERYKVEKDGLLSDLKASFQSLDVAIASVAQAEEAYRLDKARFGSGLVTATNLVISETSQTRARGSVIRAIGDIEHLVFELQRARGEKTPHM